MWGKSDGKGGREGGRGWGREGGVGGVILIIAERLLASPLNSIKVFKKSAEHGGKRRI